MFFPKLNTEFWGHYPPGFPNTLRPVSPQIKFGAESFVSTANKITYTSHKCKFSLQNSSTSFGVRHLLGTPDTLRPVSAQIKSDPETFVHFSNLNCALYAFESFDRKL